MKSLQYTGSQRVQFGDIGEPVPASGEVVIRVAAVGVCGSDTGLVRHGMPGIAMPVVMGHEFCGWREDNGELVAVNPLVSCGTCAACSRGRTQQCLKRSFIGFQRQGAFAARVAVPLGNVLRTASLSPLQAALIEPVATALHAWRRAGSPTRNVAIVGAGSIGLCLLHVLKAHGASDILVTDLAKERLDHALAMGADRVDAAPKGSFDAVFDAVGSATTRSAAVRSCAPGGTVALIGLYDDEFGFTPNALMLRDKTLVGCFCYTVDEFRDAAALVEGIDPAWVHSVPFDKSDAAFNDIMSGQASPAHVKTQFVF